MTPVRHVIPPHTADESASYGGRGYLTRRVSLPHTAGEAGSAPSLAGNASRRGQAVLPTHRDTEDMK